MMSEKYPCQVYVNGVKRNRHWLLHLPQVNEVMTFESMEMKVTSCRLDLDRSEYRLELAFLSDQKELNDNSGFMRTGWDDAPTTQAGKQGKHSGGKRN